jgi:hypothetical protein
MDINKDGRVREFQCGRRGRESPERKATAASGFGFTLFNFFLEKKFCIGVCRVSPGCHRSGSWPTAEHDFFLPRLQLCSFFTQKKFVLYLPTCAFDFSILPVCF